MIIFIFLQKENFRESLIDILHNVDNAIQDNDDSDAATLEHTVNTAVYNTTYILTYYTHYSTSNINTQQSLFTITVHTPIDIVMYVEVT